jgi:hypothetical protein
MGACGSDDNKTEPDASKPPTCTPQNTEELTTSNDLSKLLAVAADEPSKEALRSQVVSECCPPCPTGSATERPLLSDAETCVTCAGGYSGGNPADHVRSCATNVCKPK